MSTGGAGTRERLPRRGRYLIPKTAPRRAELLAVCGVVTIIAHLLFAQLTIVLAVIFHVIGKVTRWRPQWLAVPAAAGMIWALATGPARALNGLLAGPRDIVAYLGGVNGAPGRALHLGAAFAGAHGWLPRQFPLALVTGAAEAALAAWLGWLHTDEWQLAPPRPGLVSAVRRWYTARDIRLGGVVTRDGVCLGIAAPSGGRVALSWREAAGGVLCAGAPGSGTTTTSFQLVHAAIRRRKPVIAVDLSGSRQLAEWFAIVCAAAGAPLQVVSAAGNGYYEPLREGDPARRTALVMGMIDWTGTAGQYRRSCAAYLNDLFAVTDAAPGNAGTASLDELLHLLNPAALRARAQRVPGFHPDRDTLVERVKVSASLFEADPKITATLANQLGELRAAPIGRWLAPEPATSGAVSSRVDLGQVMRQRAVSLFSLGGQTRPTTMVASLVAQDAMAICGELRKIGVAGDAVLWFEQCGAIPVSVLAELVRRGASAGVASVLTSTSPAAADNLASQVNAVAIHRMTDPVMAERFARATGTRLVPAQAAAPTMLTSAQFEPARPGLPPSIPDARATGGGGAPTAGFGHAGGLSFVPRPAVPPETLFGLAKGEFVLAVKAPRRLIPLATMVPARLHVAPRRAAARSRTPALTGAAMRGLAHPRQPLGINGDHAGSGKAPERGVEPGGRQRPVPGRHAAVPVGSAAPDPPRRLTGAPATDAPERRSWPT